ncbi:MAG: filamentous hemagglutinin N-terminal domain-containing protein [Cyanobacteria bacterium P01_F01_bin.143]
MKLPVIIFPLLLVDGVQAQVNSDRSLSTEVTTQDNLNFTITEGDRAGNNLFHSFQEFSVPTNGSAIFENAATVENIINRVTGDFSSNIDGLIEANGSANVFLINPNGIVFGENAVLNIGGSFMGTTAESLLFEEGFEFSTLDDGSKPLLTVNVPLGVRFGNNPATITNRSQTTIPNPDPTVEAPIIIGLSTAPGKTLALIGGNIEFDGGVITVTQGKIELGSVADNNVVTFNVATDSWIFDYGTVTQFQNITLDNLALVTASGEGGGGINLQEVFVVPSGESGGEIHIQGKEIRVLNGSEISSDTFGIINGKDITINASELVEIRGSDPTLNNIDPLVPGVIVPLPSKISTNTFAPGNAGNINITTGNLLVLDGAKIELQTIGNPANTDTTFGSGGNLVINAKEAVILRGNKSFLGVTDDVEDEILPSLTVDEAIDISQASTISTASASNGVSGNVNITTDNLSILEGAIIATTPLAMGDGGDITVTARKSIEIDGVSPRTGSIPSTLGANTFAQGNGGDIDIISNLININNGGTINTTTISNSKAGRIEIQALRININGISDNRTFSSRIGTEALRIEGLEFNSGTAGNLEIISDSLTLNNQGVITANTSSGDGGNITIDIKNNLILRNDGEISTRAFENANGGNINISANFVIALPSENSDILANAERGNGGNITITTEGIVGLEVTEGSLGSDLSEINASSEFGQNGSVTVVTPDEETVQPERDVNRNVSSLDRNSLDNYCRNLGKSSYTVTGRGGIPSSPEDKNLGFTNWEDWRIMEEEPKSQTNSQNTNPNSEITDNQELVVAPQLAQGWVRNEKGQIILTSEPLVITPHPQQLTNPGC